MRIITRNNAYVVQVKEWIWWRDIGYDSYLSFDRALEVLLLFKPIYKQGAVYV